MADVAFEKALYCVRQIGLPGDAPFHPDIPRRVHVEITPR
jgi:hypothetical protein